MTPSELIASNVFANVTRLIEDMRNSNIREASALDAIGCKETFDEPAQENGWSQVDENDYTFKNDNGETSEASTWEQLCREQYIEPFAQAPMEYYAVSEELARALSDEGELVLMDFYNLHVWGRCGTGQAVRMDDVFARIIEKGFKR